MKVTTLVLTLSLVIQVVAAVLSLRLVWTTGQRLGWGLIAAAAVLLAVRGLLALAGGFSHEPDIETELIALFVGLFMAAGAGAIGPVFREARRVQQALAESEARFRHLFENAQVGIYRTTPDGRILMVNPALLRMLKCDSFDRLASRNLEMEGFGPSYRREEFKRLVERPEGVRGLEAEWVCFDGSTIFVRENAVAVRDADGSVRYYDGMVEDITQSKELERRLLHAQKMEALGRLAGGVAHDFNNLLTAILGYATLLLDRIPEGDPMRPAVEEVISAGRRASSLTSQMLIFSRRQVVQARPLDMNTVVKGMEGLLRRLLGEAIEFEADLQADLWTVKADQNQMEQVILNLVVNGRDAMPSGGRLSIRTRNVELQDELQTEHLLLKPGTYVAISVSDTGHGMTPEVRSHLFEPFFTTKPPGKGTGLGLAAVYGIVKQGGGAITVETALGQGSTFTILLPRVEAIPKVSTAETEVKALPLGHETLLLVEDEASVRGLFREVLERYGYRVLVASRGEEAMEIALTHEGPIHLLVSDVVMPGMSGHELARRLQSQRHDMKVLYISGYSDTSVEGLVQTGASFLQKPFTPGDLAQAVRAVLEGRHVGGLARGQGQKS